MYQIKDESLWESGARKIEWAKENMPLLKSIEDDFSVSKPFKGLKIALSVHLEAKTARLCKALAAAGAEMYITGSNPLSTQDDVAAALVHDGLNVFAVHGATEQQYHDHVAAVVKAGPNLIIDDGGDIVNLLHNEYPELAKDVIGGCEETTTGVMRLVAMNKAGELKFPMALVNNARCKYLFDNRYGTGQSVWDGIIRTTNLVVTGKNIVVAGYGWCGKGVAMRAKGYGARVIITEVDPIKAMEAVMDGFTVMKMSKAAEIGDLFVTVTGCKDVITGDDMLRMKNGAIVCNAGHFDCEVDVRWLRENCESSWQARNNIMGYRLSNGRNVYALAEGRLVNLAAGDGHPVEIMDMSFAIQALTAAYMVEHKGELNDMIINVPEEIDLEVARRKLRFWGTDIDTLTPEQERYLNSWQID